MIVLSVGFIFGAVLTGFVCDLYISKLEKRLAKTQWLLEQSACPTCDYKYDEYDDACDMCQVRRED